MAAMLFMAGIGYGKMSSHLIKCRQSLPAAHRIYKMEILSAPEKKKKTYACKAAVHGYYSNKNIHLFHERSTCIIYLKKEARAARLMPGDCIAAHTHFSPFQSDMTFDYARFMQWRGISGSAFLPAADWKLTGKVSSLRTFASSLRSSLLSHYRRSGLTGDRLAVLSAITVGSREELRDELRDAYAAAGVSHVLALSGLHIGLIYGFSVLLLRPLWRRWRVLRLPLLGTIILLLWMFAFLTGCSPSTVRAVLMISLFTLSYLRTADILSLDTLLTSAFIMLLFRPWWMFEAGFQLSFLSVASICTVFPLLSSFCHPGSKLGKRVWEALCITTAAQAGTAPLVLYYFHQFPVHFLWTNLLIIPLVTLILYLGILLILLFPFPVLASAAASAISCLLQFQHHLLHRVESLPFATLEGNISLTQLFLLYLFILFLLLYISRPVFKHLSLTLTALCVILLYPSARRLLIHPSDRLEFYRIRGVSLISRTSSSRVKIYIPPTESEEKEKAAAALSRHLAADGKAEVYDLSTDTVGNSHIFISSTLLSSGNCRIAVVSDNHWRNKTSREPLQIDCLFIRRGFSGRIDDISKLFRFQTAVLDSNLAPAVRRRIIRELSEISCPYYLFNSKGYCSIMR